eukprot:scaffold95664_cov36-Phaeocystis_antarctica.AAC.2
MVGGATGGSSLPGARGVRCAGSSAESAAFSTRDWTGPVFSTPPGRRGDGCIGLQRACGRASCAVGRDAVRCGAMRCDAVRCGALPCVAVRRGALRWVAVRWGGDGA